jgi:hypothetical protein
LRKFTLLAAGLLLAGGVLAACIGPPPPTTDPHDVLVVGDSVSFSFGCALGDPGELNGVPQSSCPPAPGATYTTRNDWVGACTITPGTLSLYNGGQAGAPNCDTVGAGSRGDTWQSDANHFVPKVVVINTAGWEIVDRWQNVVAQPDLEWGAPGCTPNNVPPSCQMYQNAAVAYSSELFNAINTFRNSANHPTVIVTNAPYINPLEPEPPFGSGVPDSLACSWWEPFPNTAPNSAGPDCRGDATQGSGGQWRSPTGNTSYRSDMAKMDQLNQIVQLVKDNDFASDSGVKIFNFKSHFNAGPANTYTDYVCPPPHDTDTTAQNLPDVRPGSPTFGQMVWQCDDGSHIPTNYVNAILARAADHSHLSPAGIAQVLQPYIDKCVRAALGASGGDPAACN